MYSDAKIEDPEWYYLQLLLVTNSNETPTLTEALWKQLILQALATFQGVFGQSIHFDVLKSDNRLAAVRVPSAEKASFIDCIVASILELDPKALNLPPNAGNGPLTGSLRIEARSQFLNGVTAPPRFTWAS